MKAPSPFRRLFCPYASGRRRVASGFASGGGIFMPFCDVGDAVFLRKRGFSEMECFVCSAKGAFPKWNASFSQKNGLFRSGMPRFLSKRGFSEVECFVFSEKGAFPGWNASFSQKMRLSRSGMLRFLRKRGFSEVECFVFSEKGSCSCEASFSQKKEGGFARDPREGYTLRGRLHHAASASLLCGIFAQ